MNRNFLKIASLHNTRLEKISPLKTWWAWLSDYYITFVTTLSLVLIWNQFLLPMSLVFYPFNIMETLKNQQAYLVLSLIPIIHFCTQFLSLYLFQTTLGLYQFKNLVMPKFQARQLSIKECFAEALFSTLSLGSLGVLLKLREKILTTHITDRSHFYQTFQNHYSEQRLSVPQLADWCDSEVESTQSSSKAA